MSASHQQQHVQHKEPDQQRLAVAFAAVVFYGVCSGSMSFINKLVLTSYGFDFPFFIMFIQMIFTAALLTFLSKIGKISLPATSVTNLKICGFASIFGLLHSVLSLSALSGMNVAMYTVLKRCVPLMSLLLTPFLMKKGVPRWSVVGSVCMMTAGCVIAGIGDLTFDLKAYTYGIMSVLSQALYLTLVQGIGLQNDAFSPVGIMYLNSINCLMPLLLFSTASSEFTQILQFKDLFSPGFLLIFAIVISMGCMLNYAVFLCTILTSALTTSVVGVIKSVIVVIIGLFAFGGIPITILSVIGICMNTIGGGWYTYEKYQAKDVDKAADVETTSTTQEFTPRPVITDNNLKNGNGNAIGLY